MHESYQIGIRRGGGVDGEEGVGGRFSAHYAQSGKRRRVGVWEWKEGAREIIQYKSASIFSLQAYKYHGIMELWR